jgi:hypothetical protein
MECLSVISNQNTITTIPQLNSSSYKEKQSNQIDLLSSSSSKQISRTKKQRGPRYSRINEKSQPLLKRLVGTIFGDYGITTNNNKKQQQQQQQSKKSLLPSKSTIKKQFEENEQILRSLLTLLTQIESNKNLSIENEQSRNNNQIDENDTYHPKSKISKFYRKKKYSNNKKRQTENDILDSCSIISHYSSQQKMVDNQQQTQLYPIKINIGTSTQFNDIITSELSWLDVMREDQTTINAWSRIRRRLKPNQQKDILR